MRVLKIAGMVLAGFLLLLLLTTALLLGTETGTRLTLQAAAPLLPDGISLGESRGRLLDRLILRGLQVETDTLAVTVAELRLQWRPAGLLRRHLEITELDARGVRYRALPAPAPAPPPEEPFALPERFDLPLSVSVQRLRVENVEIFPVPDADAPLVLDRLALSGRFHDARLELTELAARGPTLAARVAGHLLAAGDYPLAARAEWRVALNGYAPLVGVTHLDGSVRALQFRQQLEAPYGLEAAGTVHDLLVEGATAGVTADLRVDDLALAAVGADLPDARVSASAQISGPFDALEVQVSASGADPQQRRFQAALEARLEPQSLELRQLTVTQPGRAGRLRGKGRVGLEADLVADLEVAWEALQWPLAGEPTLTSPHGTLRVVGPPDDYRLDLLTRIEPLGQPPVELRLKGAGSREAAELELAAALADGRLGGSLVLDWSDEFQLAVQLEGQGVDPGVVLAEWPGSVDLSLAGTASLAQETLTVRLAGLEASGRLRGAPLALRAAGEYRQAGDTMAAEIDDLDLTLGSTRAAASGRLDERLDLRWRVQSDDLSELLPEAGGRMRGAGTLSGRMPALRVDAEVQARDLAFAGYALHEFDARADVDLTGRRPSAVAVTASDGALGEVAVQRLEIRGEGLPGEHRVTIAVQADEAQARAALTGRFDEDWQETRRWRFEMDSAQLDYDPLPAWQLVDRARGVVSPERIRVERHCWRAEGAGLCLEAATGPEVLAVRAEVDELAMAYFSPLLPEDLEVAGALRGSLEVAGGGGRPLTARVDVETGAGRVVLPRLADAELVTGSGPPVLAFAPSRLTLDLDPEELQVAAAVNLEQGQFRLDATTPAAVVVDGGLTPEARGAQPVTGSFEVDVPDLGFVERLLPAVARTEGSVAGRLELGGTLAQPISTGRLALREGAATIVEPRIRVSDVTVTLEGRERDGFAFEAVATSGPGQVAASGVLQFLADAPVARIDLEGSDFEIMNTDDARIFASPTLRVEAGRERVAVSGVVRVPRAEITPGARTAGAVTVSPDQVLEDEEPEVEVAPREFYAEIRLIPGDEVHFSGFGLEARIEGDLRLVEAPGVPVTATGELRIVDGHYAAYGQNLDIARGRLFFAGPVTEPAVEIEAVRRPRPGILVGARVEGPLTAPQFSLFSEPVMPEQNQLAYLVLGRPLDEASGGEESALTQAALALGLRGGEALAQNIGDRLGVDELAIVTDDEEGAEGDPTQASLVVGTYLSPRLYVSYGIGLFQPESVLQVQYDLSRRWRLVTRSGDDATGADLLFTLERGD